MKQIPKGNSTTIKIDVGVWKKLNSRKNVGDTHNMVVERLLKQTEGMKHEKTGI